MEQLVRYEAMWRKEGTKENAGSRKIFRKIPFGKSF